MTESLEARLASIGDELVEVVDVHGTVLDTVTRRDMRAGRLRHRCTYVVVVNADDEVIVHQRADWKEVFPSFWDVAFGGVCGVGETWVESARRELVEEAGLEAAVFEPLGSVVHDGASGSVVGEAYLVRNDDEPTCPDGEVVAIDRVPVAELDTWLAGRDVCEDSLTAVVPLLRRHLKNL